MWFEFNQNNSGGSFVVDDKLCHRLFIEAQDSAAAERIAEDLGVYFGGVALGMDCECCGDRWYPPWDGQKFPLKYGEDKVFENIEEYAQYLADTYGWTTPDVRLYYDNGTVKEIFTRKEKR